MAKGRKPGSRTCRTLKGWVERSVWRFLRRFVGSKRLILRIGEAVLVRALHRQQDVSDNLITSIPAFAFEGMELLEVLSLDSNNIASVDRNAFQALNSVAAPNLRRLRLDDNSISSLEQGTFEGFGALTYLRIEQNPLVSLDPQLLAPLQSLEELLMETKADKPVLPIGFFSFSTKLKNFDITKWNLGPELTVDKLPLGSNETLLTLSLEYNEIIGIEVSALSYFGALTTLNIRQNDITQLPSLASLSNLRNLSISNTEVSSLALDLPTSLKQVEIDASNIVSIEPLTRLTKLTNLEAVRSQVTSIPTQIATLSDLDALSLSYNSITDVPDGIFDGLSNLRLLYFQGNSELTIRNESLRGLDNLFVLNLALCGLKTLMPNTLSGLSNLATLDLDLNLPSFQFPKDIFAGLAALTRLEVQGVVNALEFPCRDVFINHTGLVRLDVVLVPPLPEC